MFFQSDYEVEQGLEELVANVTLLKKSIAKIYNKDDELVGCGFLIDNEHIASCAHVLLKAVSITNSNDAPSEGLPIGVKFPFSTDPMRLIYFSNISTSWRYPDLDIGIMKIYPHGTKDDFNFFQSSTGPAPLSLLDDDQFEGGSCTVRTFNEPQGYNHRAYYSGINDKNFLQIDLEKTTLEGGSSGSPVWCESTKSVVAMIGRRTSQPTSIKTSDKEKKQERRVVAWATPLQKIVEAATSAKPLFKEPVYQRKFHDTAVLEVQDTQTIPVRPTVHNVHLNSTIKVEVFRKYRKLDDVETIRAISFHPDGEELVFSRDQTLWFSKVFDKNETAEREYSDSTDAIRMYDHGCSITDTCFSPCGKFLASGDANGTITVWDHQGRSILQSMHEHRDAVSSVRFSSDGRRFASSSYDETIKVWKIEDLLQGDAPFRTVERRHPIKKTPRFSHEMERFSSMAFSKDNSLIISGNSYGGIRVQNIVTNIVFAEARAHNSVVSTLDVSPTKPGYFVSGSYDRSVKVCRLDGNKIHYSTLGNHEDAVTSVAYSSDGNALVTSSSDGEVIIWNMKNESIIRRLKQVDEDAPVERVSFFPKRLDFATNAFGSDVTLWNVRNSGQIERTVVDFR